MYPRKYSLKTRYNFKRVLSYGSKYDSSHLIVKYIATDTTIPQFGVIVSSKFSKKAVIKNRVKRMISTCIAERIKDFNKNYYFIFIPRKNILNENGKISIDVQVICSEIDTFLSKMAVA